VQIIRKAPLFKNHFFNFDFKMLGRFYWRVVSPHVLPKGTAGLSSVIAAEAVAGVRFYDIMRLKVSAVLAVVGAAGAALGTLERVMARVTHQMVPERVQGGEVPLALVARQQAHGLGTLRLRPGLSLHGSSLRQHAWAAVF
jgi:hypothetical protein